MVYTIAEVSEKLNISKVTIYKKIKSLNHELKSFLTVKNGVKYLDDKGIEVIKNSIENFNQVNNNLNHELPETSQSIANDEVLTELKELKKSKYELVNQLKSEIESLKQDKHEYINLFKNQLETKDKQIEELNKALTQSQQLNENNQILLKQHQEEKVLFLENESQKEQSFWRRLFKK